MFALLVIIISSCVLYYLLQYCFPYDDDALSLGVIEILLSIATIGILICISIPMYSNYMAQAKNVSALAMVSALKIEATVHYAEYGEWAKKSLSDTEADSLTLSLHDGGAIVATRKDNGQSLGFVPLIPQSENGVDTDNVLWRCGYNNATATFTSNKHKNYTTIPTAQLPSACVQSRS
ncbi:MAG: hypothetical protein GQ569_08265 [Methylococcaceae bacterium]|nr:hypothetical protein [Methylococcaceae bacterium]